MTGDAVAELRQQRGVYKRQLTLIETWLHASGPRANPFELEARLAHLEKIASSFASVQERIEITDPDETKVDPQKESERDLFDNRYLVVKSKLMEYRHTIGAESSLNESVIEPNRSVVVDLNSNNLPTLEIPVFNGDYLEYPAFMDAFMTLVHNSTARGMTDVRKFGILKKYLGPEVLKSLKYFTLTADNYQSCLEALEKRYRKKRLIFEKFLTELCRLPVAKNTSGLRAISDNTFGILKSVELLAGPAEIKDGLLIHLILQKCDVDTVRRWEEKIALKAELPKWSEFTEYLESRCTTLECVDFATSTLYQRPETKPKPPLVKSQVAHTQDGCILCNGKCDKFEDCKTFMSLNPRDRYKVIKKKELCPRCLGLADKHECNEVCKTCLGSHHHLLHFGKTSAQSKFSSCTGTTLLATTLILIKAADGNFIQCRALLDGGSQVNFISTSMANALLLPQSSTNISVCGIHGHTKTYRKQTEVSFKSTVTNFDGKFVAIISNDIDGQYPLSRIDISAWKLRPDLKLADPKFNYPARIDLILSAGMFYPSLVVGQIRLGIDMPIMQKTLFGWIVAGNLNDNLAQYPLTPSLTAKASVQDNLEWLRKFWELEDVPTVKPWSAMEQQCERHFLQTMTRTDDGRFVVRLPFHKNPNLLGASFNMAMTRLVSTERKLHKNPLHLAAYQEFIVEYEKLNHLNTLGPCQQFPDVNLLPHFFVENANSSTTPLRVVFDASAKTASGYSLNDLLMVGPALQPDLFTHLLSLRAHPIAMVADVSKMYRQIEVAEEDRKYQCILWRNSDDELVVLQLRTVTYGTATASYIAQRCLLYLAENNQEYPLGSKTVRHNFLMDDMVTGASTVITAAEIFRQTQSLLRTGGFHLRKLMSNSSELLSLFDAADVREVMEIGDKTVTNALGLHWSPSQDRFLFRAQSQKGKLTKRSILSETARQFDPLGLIQPVIVVAKIIMQELWALKLDWDESIPQALATQWIQWTDKLPLLNEISLPRHGMIDNAVTTEIHGFSDASERAYAACIYIRSTDAQGNIEVHLLCCKSRVAPLKTVSLPRLELCACLLLAELYEAVKQNDIIPATSPVFWTDSTTALRWVLSSPHKWQSFVATRVTKTQLLTKDGDWRHVPGSLNPADIPSRGLLPDALVNNDLWWHGPNFLHGPEADWPGHPELPNEENLPEIKNRTLAWTTKVIPDAVSNCKFHDWPALCRTFGSVARFIENTSAAAKKKKDPDVINAPSTGKLTVVDLNKGINIMLKIVQRACFQETINALVAEKTVVKSHPLLSLNPFLDDEGILRVGGRLANAKGLEFQTRHPAIIPRGHVLARSLFKWEHENNNHIGPQALLAIIRQKYWPMGGKVEANKTVFRCIPCRRARPVTFQQVMGSLPNDRIQVMERPFYRTGVDFAGPVMIHYKGRGTRPTPAYLSIFVCFAVKAVHIEIVEDLTTASFINALKRFIAIRGSPCVIWSDNATNFVGAAGQLQQLKENFSKTAHWDAIYEWCRDNKHIEWKFIPPRSPHWGGLWEAAVKSAKYLLVRTIGNAQLTIHEMLTVVAEISAVLNSRPLIPLTMNVSDERPLTPGHFLIGGPLVSMPEPDAEVNVVSYKERWKLVTALKQSFWKRWSTEYLQTLQQRYKWQKQGRSPRINDVCLLVDKNSPSHRWVLGRITQLFNGADNMPRVAEVCTPTGTFKRAITQLCPLPVDAE